MDIYKLFAGRPWAITFEALESMIEMAPLRAARAASFGSDSPDEPPRTENGGVGVIPVRGTIAHHADMWSWLFGETTVDSLEKSLRQFANDPAIKSIVLDIDSPGGSASGMTELAGTIRNLRSKKAIVAVANGTAASAAFSIGASASAFYASPSSLVGSVGVYALHMDYSEAMAKEGIKPSFVQAGKFKTEGNPYEPLEDEARAHMQHIVDDTYASFVSDVALGRGVPKAKVLKDFGSGRVVTAREAKAAGMVNDVKTLDWVIERARSMRPSAPGEAGPVEDAPELDLQANDDEGLELLARLRWRQQEALAATIGGR